MREAVLTPPFCISTNYQVCVECSYCASVVLLFTSVISFVVQIYSCLFDCHHFLDQVAWETNNETEICLEDVYCGVSSRSIFKGDYRSWHILLAWGCPLGLAVILLVMARYQSEKG